MSNFHIFYCEMKDFDAVEFETGKRQKNSVKKHTTRLTYRIADRSKEPSPIAVVSNYENAVKSVGGKIAFTNINLRTVNGMVAKDGQEVWTQATKGNGQIWLTIVEKSGMTQEIVANADAFGNDIKATGHAAIYGIYFDTGKSDVKPESDAALQEVAKLLESDSALKLLVVGHTDSVGQIEANMKLSHARAEAVVQALTRSQGVAAPRPRW
jgi:OOP family OmpA-OmpF porin